LRLVVHGALAVAAVLGGVRGYGSLRLAAAREALGETVGAVELAAVRSALERHEERPAFRVAKAIQPYLPSITAPASGDALLAQCRRAVEASATVTGGAAFSAASPSAPATPRPPWANAAFEVPGLIMVGPAYKLLLRCGLASDADSFSPEIGLPAVELLGTVAKDLERGPSLLALALGLRAEKHQLTLIERMHDRSLAPAERLRLRRALQTDDLALSRRRVLVAEALLAADYHGLSADNDGSFTRALFAVVGPLAAAAQVDDITRILRADDSAPTWPDTLFVGNEGLRPSWQRLLDAPTEVALRRERVRRLLAL
jgi:hypothetical protein